MLKKFIPTLLKLFLLSLSLFFANPLFAEDKSQIGVIVWTKGDVKAINPDKTERPLQRGASIYEKDTIETSKAGSGEVAFSDGSLLSLRAESSIQIKDYKHGANTPPKKDSFIVDVVKGGFRTVTGVIPKNNPQGYTISTPLGTIGVSGTTYDIFYNFAKTKLSVAISKGSIHITPVKGNAFVLTQGTQNIGATITASQAIISNIRPTEVKVSPKIVPVSVTTEPTPGSAGKNLIKVSPCP